MAEVNVRADTQILEKLSKILKDNKLKARVGILGNKDARTDGKSNAEIGARHEFGVGVPRRSFLRMPIDMLLAKKLEKSNQFTDDNLRKIVLSNSMEPFLNVVGIAGVQCVMEAFDTGGFGQWQQLSQLTLDYKQEHNLTLDILIATHQLRDSIIYEVK